MKLYKMSAFIAGIRLRKGNWNKCTSVSTTKASDAALLWVQVKGSFIPVALAHPSKVTLSKQEFSTFEESADNDPA